MLPFLLGAAIVAPLYFSTPAQAQSLDDIQRLEEQVQRAKNHGDWGAATSLEVQLNQARLAYQRSRGMGEVSDNPYGNRYPTNGYYPANGGYYYPSNGNYYPTNGNYYPTNGNYYPTSGYYPTNGYNNNQNCQPNTGYNPNTGYYPTNGYQQQGYYDRQGRWHRR
jgi:hypothetical protein